MRGHAPAQRVVALLGAGEHAAARAEAALATLTPLVRGGEPHVTIYRPVDDGSWVLDVRFHRSPGRERAEWLTRARRLVPQLVAATSDHLADRDWRAEGSAAVGPVRIGRFAIVPPGEVALAPQSRDRIALDAGRAFGSAHHPSTQGAIVALEKLARAEPLGRVLDVGTGSGVLAIVAARLGATSVVASDIDPACVRRARTNMDANALVIPTACAVAAGPVAAADLVIANIVPRVLIGAAAQLAAAAGRTLVLSGIRRSEARAVIGTYRARGFVKEAVIARGNWVTLTLRRRDRGGPFGAPPRQGQGRGPAIARHKTRSSSD